MKWRCVLVAMHNNKSNIFFYKMCFHFKIVETARPVYQEITSCERLPETITDSTCILVNVFWIFYLYSSTYQSNNFFLVCLNLKLLFYPPLSHWLGSPRHVIISYLHMLYEFIILFLWPPRRQPPLGLLILHNYIV